MRPSDSEDIFDRRTHVAFHILAVNSRDQPIIAWVSSRHTRRSAACEETRDNDPDLRGAWAGVAEEREGADLRNEPSWSLPRGRGRPNGGHSKGNAATTLAGGEGPRQTASVHAMRQAPVRQEAPNWTVPGPRCGADGIGCRPRPAHVARRSEAASSWDAAMRFASARKSPDVP